VRWSVNELTRKLWQCSKTVLEHHSHGIELPGSGIRCTLCSIADTGMILAKWEASWLREWATLYILLFASSAARNSMNHSTYAKWSGRLGWSWNRCCYEVWLMLNTMRTCATRNAVAFVSNQNNGIEISAPCILLPLPAESPVLTSTVSKRPG